MDASRATRQAPLQSVSVAIATLGVGAFTDEQGRYSFTVPAARSAGQIGAVVRASHRLPGEVGDGHAVPAERSRRTSRSPPPPRSSPASSSRRSASSARRRRSERRSRRCRAKQLTQIQAPNLISAMSGKVVWPADQPTPATWAVRTRIVIRGAGSILGNNQPLFIVDGIPVSNAGFSTASASGGRDYGTRSPTSTWTTSPVDDGPQGPERRGTLRFARLERRRRHHDEECAQRARAARSSASRAARRSTSCRSSRNTRTVWPGLRRRVPVRRRRRAAA